LFDFSAAVIYQFLFPLVVCRARSEPSTRLWLSRISHSASLLLLLAHFSRRKKGYVRACSISSLLMYITASSALMLRCYSALFSPPKGSKCFSLYRFLFHVVLFAMRTHWSPESPRPAGMKKEKNDLCIDVVCTSTAFPARRSFLAALRKWCVSELSTL
jgi:hypothetical protein